MVDSGSGHFKTAQNLTLSSIGIGTYLGNWDQATDENYVDAIVKFVELEETLSTLPQTIAFSVANGVSEQLWRFWRERVQSGRTFYLYKRRVFTFQRRTAERCAKIFQRKLC